MRIIRTFSKLSETNVMAAALVRAGKVKDKLWLEEKVVGLKAKYAFAKAPKKQYNNTPKDDASGLCTAPKMGLKAKVYLGMGKVLKARQKAAQELSEASRNLWDNVKLANKIIGARARRVLVLKARFAELKAKYLKAN